MESYKRDRLGELGLFTQRRKEKYNHGQGFQGEKAGSRTFPHGPVTTGPSREGAGCGGREAPQVA